MSFASLLKGLDLFIERLKIGKCHMLGEGFGGYLVQCYAQYRPAKVASLVLCNSYCDMQHFVDSSPFTGFLSWMPDVLMKRFLVSDLRYKGPELDQVTAYKFVSFHSKKFDTDDLCSRLTLQYVQGPLKPKDFPVPDEVITVIDTADPIAFPDRIRLEVHKFYPSAKEVTLARGGTFPFLSVPIEFANAVDTHIQANSKNLLFSPDATAPVDANGSSSSSATSSDNPAANKASSSSAPQGTSPSSYNGSNGASEGPQHPNNHIHNHNGVSAANAHASPAHAHGSTPTKPKQATAAKQVASKKPVEEEDETSSSASSSYSSSSSSA